MTSLMGSTGSALREAFSNASRRRRVTRPDIGCKRVVMQSGVPHVRRCFYVAGKAGADAACTLYVEHLTPCATARSNTRPSLILIPGAAHTSACWVTTPDGRPGWSSFFLSHGYDIYLVDPPFTGRSPGPADSCSDHSSIMTPQTVSQTWTAIAQQQPAPWPQARLHTQWPGTGRPGDAVFETFVASLVPLPHKVPEAVTQRAMGAAGAALVDRIVDDRSRGAGDAGVVLVAHSLGAPRALLIADARPSRVSGLVLLDPNGPPWCAQTVGGLRLERPWGLTDAEITWSPLLSRSSVAAGDCGAGSVGGEHVDRDDVRGGDHPVPPHQEARFNLRTEKSTDPALSDCTLQAEDESLGVAPRTLTNLVDVPVAVITGEASHHARYDWCTVRFFKQAGVKRVDHIELWKKDIRGNGHLFISEKNSDEVAEVAGMWIDGLRAR
ncbi:alpha beta-hydrolase [Diplodia corticola]|uniref:Alpha beta-hydrolase n=1 Tax=Diplodia corticola TaxID=236234 RepID=A0A1J9RIB8_9PEZI|nr:alpha beta-hydrolase [Diplodia corticola]OJD40392.1 alpha beta-hydrolase [Diplodia corticola]